MIGIYKYTMVKYLKSASTWIILGASIFIAGFLGGCLPYITFNTDRFDATELYGATIVVVTGGITSFLAVFSSTFAGFKSATMYKDEVEDGTFLVILSKPLTRSRIIFGKWLALQTVLIFYALFTIIAFAGMTYLFDVGDKLSGLEYIGIETMKSKIIIVSTYIFIILLLIGLIFSSIALLLSTKLSVGATIGASIAIGVIIPITSLVGTFTRNNQYKVVSNQKGATLITTAQNFLDNLPHVQALDDPELKAARDELNDLIEDKNSIYNLALETEEKNIFNYLWFFDINFQIQLLSSFAYEQVIPSELQDIVKPKSRNGFSDPFKNTPLKDSEINKKSDNEIPNLIKDKLNQALTATRKYAKLFNNNTWKKVQVVLKAMLTSGGAQEKIQVGVAFAEMMIDKFKDESTTKDTLEKTDVAGVTASNVDTSGNTSMNQIVDNLVTISSSLKTQMSAGGNTKNTITLSQYIDIADLVFLLKDQNREVNDLFANEDTQMIFEFLKDKQEEFIDGIFKYIKPQITNDAVKQALAQQGIKESDVDLVFRNFNILIQSMFKSLEPMQEMILDKNAIKEYNTNYHVSPQKYENFLGDGIFLSEDEQKAISYLKSTMSDSPEKILKVEYKEYASKYLVLAIYAFIAIALVPLSYLSVKRRDFR